jgi:uncharacterized protein (TIGR04141 family)
MANQKPLQRLHVMMLKPSVSKIDEALRKTKGLQRFEISGGMNFSGALFVARPSQATPPWLQFVQTGVIGDIGMLKNRTNSSVLLVAKDASVFAMTFGHGRYLLNQDQIVEDFGLRVALNGLQKDSLRSIDSLLVEEQTVHVRRQTSRASAVDAFGIDIGRDILRAVTGTPKPETHLHALAGSEGTVAIAARVQFGDLGDACSDLRQLYGKTSYKTDFGWVDNIRRVKNSDEQKVLEEHLVKDLKWGGSSASLTVPEAIDWIECDGFLVPRTASGVMDEPDLQHYLAAIPDKEDITVEKLKRERLTMRRVSFPEAPLEWAIFRSLLFETKMKGKRYVLSSGEWYRIADSLATDVRQEVGSIPVSRRHFPAVRRAGGKQEIEGDYNSRVALGEATLSLLDRKLVRCRGAATLIEACDLLSDSGELIHVKPWSGSSSLSHLFWQARVSAEALLGDQQFRDEVRAALKEQNPAWIDRFPKGRPEPSDHEVVFAMLGTKQMNAADALPFFSQLALSRTSRFLRSSGFKVSQVGIPAVNV